MKLRGKALAALATLLSAVAFLGLPAPAGAAPSLYLANAGSNAISQFALDLAGFPSPLSPPAFATLEGPEQIALSPDGSSAYVTAQIDDRVAQYDIDRATGALTPKSPLSVIAWDAPVAIALTPDGSSAYVLSSNNDWVIQYDVDPLDGTLHEKSPSSATGSLPRDLAVSPDGASLYVADQESDQISQYDIDPEDGSLSPKAPATVATGDAPFALAVSPDGASLYAADLGSSQISQYDIDPGDGTLAPKATATVATGAEPDALAVSPDGAGLYVLNQGPGSISQYGVDPTDGSLTAKGTTSLGAGSLPVEIAFSPDGASLYVTNWSANSLLVYGVDPATGSLTSAGSVGTYAAPTGIATLADTTGPTVTIGSGPSGTVADPDASFAFTANEPDSSFECSLDAAAFQPCSSPQPYTGLADGEHSFAVRATDPWGNTGPVAQQTWTVDTTGPTATIDSGPSGTVADRDATFAFTASEPGSTLECSLGGAFSTCSSPVAYTGLADGSHVFAVRAADPWGNTGPVVQRTWTVDTSGPTATIDSGPSGTVSDRDATFAFSASELGSSFECSLGAAAFQSCSSPQSYFRLGDGEHSFRVRATDSLGNVGEPVRRRWSIRAAAPSPHRPDSPASRPPDSPPPSPGASSPSRLSLGTLRRDARAGTARLAVRVNGPGEVRLVGTRTLKGARRPAAGPGRVWLPVAPTRNARQRLRQRGRLTVSLRVVYRPDRGARRVAHRPATLAMRLR